MKPTGLRIGAAVGAAALVLARVITAFVRGGAGKQLRAERLGEPATGGRDSGVSVPRGASAAVAARTGAAVALTGAVSAVGVVSAVGATAR